MKAPLLHFSEHIVRKIRTDPDGFVTCPDWYAEYLSSRKHSWGSYSVTARRPDVRNRPRKKKRYRNPIIYARELRAEMVRHDLTRKQLAERHGVSYDRITQWLCLLKLPEEKLREVEELGDYWERQIVTEHELRSLRRATASRP